MSAVEGTVRVPFAHMPKLLAYTVMPADSVMFVPKMLRVRVYVLPAREAKAKVFVPLNAIVPSEPVPKSQIRGEKMVR
jgi:hypothetical protein